jgi:zinc/manganese transport system permease protein
VVALGYQSNWWVILTSPFMRNALIGGTIVALAAGLIGYFIIVRHTAFATHALAHIGLPGATGAVLVGLPVGVGLGIFCVGGALVIGVLGKRAADREVATGTVLAMATGLGLFFNSLATKSSSTMTNVLFGNLLAISHEQLLTFAGLLVVLAVSIGFIYRPLLFSSVNAPVAEAKGLPVRALSIIFMTLLGLTVTMAVQAVGTLLLFALVVTPAATAIMLTPRPVMAMVVSTVISVVSVWTGLAASAMFNMPPSFLIVTIACTVWLVVWLADRRVRATAKGLDQPGSTSRSERPASIWRRRRGGPPTPTPSPAESPPTSSDSDTR